MYSSSFEPPFLYPNLTGTAGTFDLNGFGAVGFYLMNGVYNCTWRIIGASSGSTYAIDTSADDVATEYGLYATTTSTVTGTTDVTLTGLFSAVGLCYIDVTINGGFFVAGYSTVTVFITRISVLA